jgi:hypothetical protein
VRIRNVNDVAIANISKLSWLSLVQRQTSCSLLRELERVQQECNMPGTTISSGITIQRRFASFPWSAFFWLYKRWLCWHKSVDDTIKALEARDEQLAREIKELSLKPDEPTGNAIIVFDWVHNAANMLHDHNQRNRYDLAAIWLRTQVHVCVLVCFASAFTDSSFQMFLSARWLCHADFCSQLLDCAVHLWQRLQLTTPRCFATRFICRLVKGR